MIRNATNGQRKGLLGTTALVLGVALACSASAAQIRFDNGAGTGLWEDAENWVGDALPTTADIADIGSTHTASVSSAQTILELQVAWPNSSGDYVAGTSTLNILPGADIRITSTNGSRIGRQVKAGDPAGSSLGVVDQTGGLLQINSGTNGLRLSQADSGTVADSYYRISGGSVRGGATNGSMTAPLQIGNINNTYARAEFHIVGSGVTTARFEDVRMQAGPSGNTVLHFSLDAGGVTPLIAEDELRFSGMNNNQLVVDLIGVAPTTDIMLVTADRLTTSSSAPAETFTNMPDGTLISASFGPYTYNWQLRYQDGSDDGVLDAFVKLEFISRTEVPLIPEPSTLLLLGLGGAAFALTRRRRY